MKLILFTLLIISINCNILIIGKAGVGKSYLINSLLGYDKAYESMTDDIGTTALSKYDMNGFSIFDTPGLFDTSSDVETTIRHYINQAKPNLIILCYDASERRLSNQDKMLIKAMNSSSNNIMDKTIVVLTQVNRACIGKYDDCMLIIKSKFNTLKSYGAIHYTYAGDKKDCAFYESGNCIISWMDNLWQRITVAFELNSLSSISTISNIYKSINKESKSYHSLEKTTSENKNGCVGGSTIMGNKKVSDLKPGDIIEQNNKLVKVLFVYEHYDVMYMYKFTILNQTVILSSEHYIPIRNKYIKARDVKVDGNYITNVEYIKDKAFYIITELEDLYIGDIPVSTYVWNYNIMKMLHIPLRWILNYFN